MAEDWSELEVAATVAAYLGMLELELRGESYNKSERNRRLQAQLDGRSAGAIEFKHANISAVLIELGFPYIDGYKPRSNYQKRLVDELCAQLGASRELERTVATAVEAVVSSSPIIRSLDEIFVDLPDGRKERSYESRIPAPIPRHGINYLEREAANASLGQAGEAFVLDVEHRRLWESGKRDLASRIEHVSKTQGDGLGYDIHSFEPDGRDLLIEVKTTNFGKMTPFFASRREVAVSVDRASHFSLYRVFTFRKEPRIYKVPGSMGEKFLLDPVLYRAMLPG